MIFLTNNNQIKNFIKGEYDKMKMFKFIAVFCVLLMALIFGPMMYVADNTNSSYPAYCTQNLNEKSIGTPSRVMVEVRLVREIGTDQNQSIFYNMNINSNFQSGDGNYLSLEKVNYYIMVKDSVTSGSAGVVGFCSLGKTIGIYEYIYDGNLKVT